MSYDEERVPWAWWWIAMWAAIAVALLGIVPLVSFREWCLWATIAFGIPEAIGLLRRRDHYPPLTFVIRRHLPRWLCFVLIYGAFGTVASYWLGFAFPWRMGALFALLGWLSDHFTSTYDDS